MKKTLAWIGSAVAAAAVSTTALVVTGGAAGASTGGTAGSVSASPSHTTKTVHGTVGANGSTTPTKETATFSSKNSGRTVKVTWKWSGGPEITDFNFQQKPRAFVLQPVAGAYDYRGHGVAHYQGSGHRLALAIRSSGKVKVYVRSHGHTLHLVRGWFTSTGLVSPLVSTG